MILFSFIIFFISSFSFSQISTANVLTLRTSTNDVKHFAIKKIRKTRDSKTKEKVIVIESYGKEKCVISLDKVINNPRPNYAGCDHCIKSDIDLERYYTELFLNRRSPHISCDVLNGNVIGFTFIGGTKINGKGVFVSRGLAFDFAKYQSEEFLDTGENTGALRKVLNEVEDILLDIAF